MSNEWAIQFYAGKRWRTAPRRFSSLAQAKAVLGLVGVSNVPEGAPPPRQRIVTRPVAPWAEVPNSDTAP